MYRRSVLHFFVCLLSDSSYSHLPEGKGMIAIHMLTQ
jgi:hypothetical protein